MGAQDHLGGDLGGAGVRLLLILATVVAGWVWVQRPHDGPTDSGTLSVARDRLVHRTHGWAPASRAELGPGVRTFTGYGQCTANFVFSDRARNLYLGQAAHCAETAESVDGCTATSRPLGTPVAITRGDANVGTGRVIARGRLAYSSWLTMQRLKEKDKARCAFNDFALIRLPRDARKLVNPSMPFWGGPIGLADRGMSMSERVFGFGRSELRKAHSHASRQSAVTLADAGVSHGWSHSFVGRSPGIPGDSGSGYLDSAGEALGTLSTLRMSFPMVNAIGDLRHELRYARAHSGISGLRLELGTVAFRPDRAPHIPSG